MKKNLLIDSSGYVLKLLQKILDTNIEIQGLENIPKDNPRIFVANHFTRMEAMVVPYWLYHKTNKKVGVIADDSIFISFFGDFLKNIGALSKSHPNRDNIIMSDILQGKKDWLIFPEGRMVKGKRIIREDDEHYSVKIDNVPKKVYTGAAYFGLDSQLLREDYLNNKIHNKERFMKKYLIDNLDDINDNETMIVPVNISYSPIRTGNNFLVDIAKKLLDNLNDQLLEELEIEGNIILNSKIIIQILEPISLKKITHNEHIKEDCHECTKKQKHHNHKDFINRYRRNLTNEFMKNIYENLTIRFDHIFVLILYFSEHDIMKKEHLKRLIYLVAKEIKDGSLFFDSDIDHDIIRLISYEDFEPFEDVLKVAIKDGIIIEAGKNYVINKPNLLEGYTHHTIRLKNILKVVLNEVLIIHDVVQLVQSYSVLTEKGINFMLSNKLINEELNEFEEDRNEYLDNEDLKEEYIGKPYFLDNESSKTGIITVHGFSSAPLEVKEMGSYLNKKGFNIYAPRIKGHGTTPQDLQNTTWKQWYNSLSRAIAIASIKYDKFYIAGFSAGGLLALLSSQKNCPQLKGLICINAALYLKDIRVKAFVPAVNLWNEIVSSVHIEDLQKEYVTNDAEYPLINYDKHFVKSIFQLNALMNNTQKMLSHVKDPVLVIQGKNDPVVNPHSAKEIYLGIKSKNKAIVTLDFDNHVIIKGENNELVFEEINKFIL